MRIGLVGSGRLGATLGRLLAAGGHEVFFSALGSGRAEKAAQLVGCRARSGTPLEAAGFGDVVVIAVPWESFPDVAKELGGTLAGRIVIDPSNPITERDGEAMVFTVPGGLPSPQHQQEVLGHEVRLVRTFNTKFAHELFDLGTAGQRGDRRADMPYWADDDDAKKSVVPLIEDAGFTAIDAGPLADAR